MSDDRIVMAHGSGGDATSRLIKEVFEDAYGNEYLSQMEDSTRVEGSSQLALTTDSFVVDPIVFKGGDIGRLSICGTVNDLAVRGAKPKYLTVGFILEEGLRVDTLKQVVRSLAETADEAGVMVVAGDTKVINGNGGMYINTAGVGFLPDKDISAKCLKAGDAIIVSGNLGDHHAALLSSRMGISNDISSDAAPLNHITEALMNSGLDIHAMRDVTRGGLATVLKEMALSAQVKIEINEELIPVSEEVRAFAGLMGLDPLYMGNEGKFVLALPSDMADEALRVIKGLKYGADACIIGQVSSESVEEGELLLNTKIGGKRRLNILSGEGLPRIC